MAAFRLLLSQILLLLSSLFLVTLPRPCDAEDLKACGFDAIYNLGDSLSDTGNLIRESPLSTFGRFPYGETYFRAPTGRCSNGLLIIDYIASSAGLPFLRPFLDQDASFTQGVNFAVAGATALPLDVLLASGVLNPLTKNSLSVQLGWMSWHFNRTCGNDKGCLNKLKNALFIVGEIGGNDLNYASFKGKTLDELKAMVPKIVQSIKDAINTVIAYGATRVIVPGNFPIGCLPIYLTRFKTQDRTAYNEFHCLKKFNNLSVYQNDNLKQAIEELKKQHPNVTLVYADYYNAFQMLLSNAKSLGFDTNSTMKACCGVGGDYNFSLSPKTICGAPGVQACSNPDQYLSWDGVHLTQRAYSFMSRRLINDIYPELHCKTHA